MAKIVTEVSIKDVDSIKVLFELIGDNTEYIREPLLSKIQEWIDSENAGWVKWGDLREFVDNSNCTVLLNGEEQLFVTGYNKVLRKVELLNKEIGRLEVVKAESFSVANSGQQPYVEW